MKTLSEVITLSLNVPVLGECLCVCYTLCHFSRLLKVTVIKIVGPGDENPKKLLLPFDYE